MALKLLGSLESSGGDLQVLGTVKTSTHGDGLVFGSPTTVKFKLGVYGANDLLFKDPNNNVLMTLTAAGNVGIGTAPSSNLHVHGAGGSGVATQIKVTQADDGAGHPGAAAILQSSGWGEAFLKLSGHQISATGGDFNVTSSTDLALQTNGTNTRMFIKSGGDIGIGTTAPLEKLHVAGKINSSNNIVSNATYTMFTGRSSRTVDDYGGLNKQYFKANLVTPGPNTTGESSAHGIADLRFQLANSAGNTGMSDIMTLRSGGNVGVGTTTPNEKLTVAGNIHAYAPSGINAGLFASTAAGATSIAIRSSGITFFNAGNVGIGTTTPQRILDVNVGGNSGVGASFAGTISAGEYQGIHFGYSEAGNGNYRHSAIVFERDDATHGDARGKIHILNSASGSSSADLGDSKLTILPSGNVGIGTTSPSSESNLSLGAKSASEGGHLTLFKGTSNTHATHIDNYEDSFRIMKGTDASSSTAQFSLSHATGNATFAGAVSTGGYLTLNSSDDIPRLIFNGSGDDFMFSNTANYFGLYNDTDSRWDIQVDGAGTATFGGAINSGTITSTGIVKAATTFQSTAGSMSFYVPNVGQALEIAQNTGNATFAGNVTLSSTAPVLYLANTTSSTGKTWYFSSAPNGNAYITQDGVIDAITLSHTSGNATFAGNVTATNILTVAGAATGSPYLQFTQGGSQKAYIQYADSGDSFELQSDNQFAVRTGGSTAALIINSSQNATFAGDVTLSAAGSTGEIIRTTDNTEPYFAFQRNSGSNGVGVLRLLDGGDLAFDTGATGAGQSTRLTIDGSNGNATFAADVTVGGNLIVNGTTTTLNTTTVEVEDNILQLNTTQGSPNTMTAATSGISVFRGLDTNGNDTITQASLIFDEGDDTWDLTNNLAVAGTLSNPQFEASATAVTLKNAGNTKLLTTGGGVDITGALAVGNINMTGALDISATYPRINLNDTNHEDDWSIINDDGSFKIYNVDDDVDSFKIDASNNATFAGAISMSDSILINYTGNDGQAIDAGVKVMNDGSDWGMYVRKHSNADYGIRIDSGGANAFNIYSTTGGSGKTFSVHGGTGRVTHNGIELTSGFGVDQIREFPMTFQLAADTWTDTGIDGADLSTGTYAMQVYVSDFEVGGHHYYEYYSATISWYGGGTNSTAVDEIPVHRAGHAPNTGDIQFRTQRASGTDSHDLMLQVKTNRTYTEALDNDHGGKIMRFKFRRLM
jgi:hypothetical protein